MTTYHCYFIALKLKINLYNQTVPLADSHEIKGFYKGYFRQNKGCFIEILTKIKSKLRSSFLVFSSDPDLEIHVMIDGGMKEVQKILSQQIYSALITNLKGNYSCCLLPSRKPHFN